MTSTLLNAAYFMPIVYKAWFEPWAEDTPGAATVREAPALVVAPLVLTAAGTVLAGFFPDLLLRLARGVLP